MSEKVTQNPRREMSKVWRAREREQCAEVAPTEFAPTEFAPAEFAPAEFAPADDQSFLRVSPKRTRRRREMGIGVFER